MSSHRQLLLTCFILVLCETALAKFEHKRCCLSPGNLIVGSECSDQSNVTLTCTKFLLNSSVPDDEYRVLDTGDLETKVHNGFEVISQNEYCISNMSNDKGVTYEIALVCFGNPDKAEFLFGVKAILFLISVFFILATLYVYKIIPELRETLDKATCFAIGCLAIFMFVLSLIQVHFVQVELCGLTAYFVYFFTIAYFAWLNCVMANIFKISVLNTWRISERRWYLLNHLYAWSVAIGLTVFVVVTNNIEGGLEPGFGVSSCWFNDKHEQLYMLYYPVMVLLLLNVVLTLWSAFKIHKLGQDISPDRKRVLWYKCKLYLKLFIMGGCTWFAEILSFLYGNVQDPPWYWIMTDVINGLHGALIFFVLIIWRHRIRRELAGRTICCYRAPDRWAQLRDNEQAPLADEGCQMVNDRIENGNGMKL